jgi:tetratricopeptide (TPR) repeat protein
VTFQRALLAIRAGPDDEALLSDLARSALAEGHEETALGLLRRGAERRQSALLWQWAGLLERSLDEHEQALASFERAAALAPGDRTIAHGRARVTLEAGIPAEALFDTAMRLAPGDGDVLLGYAASLFAEGNGARAELILANSLARSPLWLAGHVQLAQLRSTMGKKGEATASIEEALKALPQNQELWSALLNTLLQSEQFDALDEAVARARSHSQARAMLLRFEAIAASEQRQTNRADRLFAEMDGDVRRSVEIWRIRHLLRSGRIAEASSAIDAALKTDQAPNIWPYAAIAWRLTGDRRSQWLEGDLDRMVSVVDLASELPDMVALENALRALHVGKGEYLDQSVRGGSQTDGPLLTNIHPEIRALRAAIVAAVERHAANLPPLDPRHPLLAPPRDRRIRFAGSWSVLLRSGGFHANHVHPQGWISSALYIHLPEAVAGEPKTAGWLTLGEPQAELGLDLEPFTQVEPKPGRLVLFPSYMWHGTRRFAEGERLTVAFDVRPPR